MRGRVPLSSKYPPARSCPRSWIHFSSSSGLNLGASEAGAAAFGLSTPRSTSSSLTSSSLTSSSSVISTSSPTSNKVLLSCIPALICSVIMYAHKKKRVLPISVYRRPRPSATASAATFTSPQSISAQACTRAADGALAHRFASTCRTPPASGNA